MDREVGARCMYNVYRWIDARNTSLSTDYLEGAARRQVVDRVHRWIGVLGARLLTVFIDG